ncbi:hypothetical protein [Marinobacter sp.]|uniref:hypothetical protein n=1 Tax=Marinobacter sp. TaxID=50741 RepID=UPI003A930604
MGFSGDRLIDSQGEIETLDYTCSVVIGRTLGVEEASTKSVPVDVKAFPKLWRAKDGPTQAHMDVLVACFGKAFTSAGLHLLRI